MAAEQVMEWARFGQRWPNRFEENYSSGKQLYCFVPKLKGEGFKLDLRRNCTLGPSEWPSPLWALSGVLGGCLCCPYSYAPPDLSSRLRSEPFMFIFWVPGKRSLHVDCLYESPPCVGCGIICDEWVPRWARNDYTKLTLDQGSSVQNWDTRTIVITDLLPQFQRAIGTTNHFITSKERSDRNRAQERHEGFAKS